MSTILCALACAPFAFSIPIEETTYSTAIDAASSSSSFIRVEDDLEGTAAQNEVAPDIGEDGTLPTDSTDEVYVAPDEGEYQEQTSGQSEQTGIADDGSGASVDEVDSFPSWIIPTSVGFAVLALICIFASVLLRRKSGTAGAGGLHSKK
ncbi:MAG: hypothetical protein HGA54_03040 [Actinobacteria bacterium]|nr:hypothetical protein [Actinomycetota bacterium]